MNNQSLKEDLENFLNKFKSTGTWKIYASQEQHINDVTISGFDNNNLMVTINYLPNSDSDKTDQYIISFDKFMNNFNKDIQESITYNQTGKTEALNLLTEYNQIKLRHINDNYQTIGGKSKRKPFDKCTVAELKEKAKSRNIKGYSKMTKDKLIAALRRKS